eukprot:jgi/Bigna1/66958/fgenesh1_pg.2_\
MGDTRGVEQEGMSAGGQEPRDPRCEDVAAGKEGTLNDDDDAAADPNVEGDRRDLEDLKRKYSFLKRFSEGVCYRDGGILPRNPKDFGVWGEADGNPLKLRPINTNFFDAMESILHDGDAYQFGVLDGESLGWLQGIMEDNFFWGFDSFEERKRKLEFFVRIIYQSPNQHHTSILPLSVGLPDEDEKVPNLNAWSQGKFRNTMSLEELSNIYGGVYHPWSEWRTYFIVEDIGENVECETGFEMSPKAVQRFTTTNGRCRLHFTRDFGYTPAYRP